MPMLITLRIALAGVARSTRPQRTSVGERRHPVEHLVHLRHDVLAVDDDRASARHAQRDVQHGAVLGDVDLLAAEHRVDALGEPHSSASWTSSRSVSSVTRFFE